MQHEIFGGLALDLRGKHDVTFGVWCEVVAPGRVRVGDQVVTAT